MMTKQYNKIVIGFVVQSYRDGEDAGRETGQTEPEERPASSASLHEQDRSSVFSQRADTEVLAAAESFRLR